MVRQRTRYVVEPRDSGFVVIDRDSASVVTPVLRRLEAQREVWERNGRLGFFRPATALKGETR